jgi:ABC-type sugar transport system, periplasmic component
MRTKTRRGTVAIASAVAASVLLAACSGGSAGPGDEGAAALDAALEEGGTIEYWTYNESSAAQAEAFMAAYPNVEVDIRVTPGVADHNLAFQNVLTAGSGIPDVIQLEYQSVLQYQLPGHLLDLTAYGLDELEDTFTASTWNNVSTNGGLWGLPQDSAPMAMFYNAALLEAHGLDVPETWDDFVTAGKALKAADPNLCIVNEAGDAGFTTSMIWQAGGHPFATEGETVSIDLQDAGSKRWAATWNEIIQNDLNCEYAPFSNEWFQAFNAGTVATLLAGAWMTGAFPAFIADGAGDWRVAQLPSHDGTRASAENGGSTHSVTAKSQNPALAAAFLRWISTDPAAFEAYPAMFPSTVAELESDEFLGREDPYFGGQKVNEVFAASIEAIVPGWQYLPWQVYANSIVPETVGQAYLNKSDLNDGLLAWQERNIRYAQEQGFTVE